MNVATTYGNAPGRRSLREICAVANSAAALTTHRAGIPRKSNVQAFAVALIPTSQDAHARPTSSVSPRAMASETKRESSLRLRYGLATEPLAAR